MDAFYLVELRHVTKLLTKSENLETSNLRINIDILDLSCPSVVEDFKNALKTTQRHETMQSPLSPFFLLLLAFLVWLFFTLQPHRIPETGILSHSHNVTLYAGSYESNSHNYLSDPVNTVEEAMQEYPYYLNAVCDLSIGYPSSNYPTKMLLYCSDFELNPSSPHIPLQQGANVISNYELKSTLEWSGSGLQKYAFFWFGQLTLSVDGTVFNATLGANATLSCYDLTICNGTNYCIDNIQPMAYTHL